MARGSNPFGLLILLGIGAAIWLVSILVSKIRAQVEILATRKYESRQRELLATVEASKDAALNEIKKAEQLVLEKERYVTSLKESFAEGYIGGRQWLAKFVAESDKVNDERLANYFKTKSHPAPKTAQIIAEVKRERRETVRQLKYLEYQLLTYKEYFPFLEEFEEAILDDKISSNDGTSVDLDQVDKVSLYISKDEYDSLSITEKNQLALNNYIKRNKSNWEIGRLYERYIGHLYECDGWDVEYHGAVNGYEDLGRDLICRKGDCYLIVQAKCWSRDKVIREKHVFQLFGTSLAFEIENNVTPSSVRSVLVSTAEFSDVARAAAGRLGVELRVAYLSLDYPMIKCNINQGNRIYHLPFDQQYDRVKLRQHGERYAKTVEEAERDGFRRAWRHNVG